MAQHNQESIPVDSGSFPARRKRGRPRKYDDSGYKPRWRYMHSSSALMQGGSSQGSQAIPVQHNPTAILGLGSQALPVQMNPTSSSVPNNQVISAQANYSSIAGFTPQSLPLQPNIARSSCSRPKPVQLQTNTTCVSGNIPNSAQTEANQTAGISLEYHAVPSQANLFVVPQGKQPVSPSHGQHTLIGQAVCGILDGTFDAGYLLTVRVGSTGDVLKGLVFDPCSIVPISEKNDIAPLLPVVSSLRGNLYPIAEAPRNEPTSVSDHPAVTTPVLWKGPDAPTKLINHETETSANVSEFSKIAPCDDNQANHDASQVSQADVRVKTFHDEIQAVNNADDKSQQSVVDGESEIPASLSATNKESSEALVAKQTGKLIEIVGVDCSQEQATKSSAVEPSGGHQDMQQTEKQTENVIKELEDREQHLAEEKSSGMFPTIQRSVEHVQLPDEPKCGISDQTLSESAVSNDLFNAEVSKLQ